MQLYESLKKYSQSPVYPFHMPGHKRMHPQAVEIPYGIDITEISGFDNLHEPHLNGLIWQMYETARQLYETEETYPLINGSTAGNMAAVTACCDLGDEIIIGRNCHKSVYRVCELLGLKVHYFYPEYQAEYGIFANAQEEVLEQMLLQYPQAKCVVLTSPTYEGVILNIEKLARVVHAHGRILIVDEAHGAHLPFCSKKDSAIAQGADFIVQSLHKTLPSLTQTAVLHVCRKSEPAQNIAPERIKECVSLYQSTSPSYILMAGMEECFRMCADWSTGEPGRFSVYWQQLQKERQKYADLQTIHLLEKEDINAEAYDPGKFVFLTSKAAINGPELFARLRDDYGLELEMAAQHYVVAIMSVCDRQEGWDRLCQAVHEIDRKVSAESAVQQSVPDALLKAPYARMTLREGMQAEHIAVSLEKLKFQLDNDYVATSTLPLQQVYQPYISGGYIMVYPPGIPIVAPGEEITAETAEQIKNAMEQGLEVLGLSDGKITLAMG